MRRSARRKAIEERYGMTLEMLLRSMWYEQRMTLQEIAIDLEVPAGTVSSWTSRLGIQSPRGPGNPVGAR